MFSKNKDREILDELKKLNDNMEQNNKLLQEIWDNTKDTKINTSALLRINSNITDLNNVAQVLLDIKTDNESKRLSETKEKVDEKPYDLKYKYKILNEKPQDPKYHMKSEEENNDLLNEGKYKSKYNVTIKSNEIDLDKVDWDKSYLIIDYNGMTNYRLMLKQNERSFSKWSDIRDNVHLYRFKTLVLHVNDEYIEIDLNLFDFTDNSNVTDEDSGEDWLYKKIEIDLDK